MSDEKQQKAVIHAHDELTSRHLERAMYKHEIRNLSSAAYARRLGALNQQQQHEQARSDESQKKTSGKQDG